MASQSRRTSVALSRQLADEPFRFEFFQAVRLLERMARRGMEAREFAQAHGPVGHDELPNREVVRFRVLPALTFPPSEIVTLKISEAEDPDEIFAPMAEMVVPFLGLIGPSGVLPRHYTQLVIERLRKKKDSALRDYLDLFHHRTISFFFRAWEKYRLPPVFERAALDRRPDVEDAFTRVLYCLTGFGTRGLRARMAFHDDVLLYYSGSFAHRPRTATSLEDLLQEYLQLPVEVIQFQGGWLQLGAEYRSETPSIRRPRGRNCQLGVNTLVGRRVWSVENKFRIRLGPLTYTQFCRFLPAQPALIALCQLVRTFVGAEFDFDVQPVLRADQVPRCRMGAKKDTATCRLGQDTWLPSQMREHDATEAVFEHDGNPQPF